MPQIQKGTTYADVSPDNLVTSANLNAHVDDAILLAGAITGQTPLTTTAGGDRVLVADASLADALSAVTLANLLPPEAITDKTDISTSIAAADELLMADASDSYALKAVQAQYLLTPEAITNKTDISTSIAATDELLMADASDTYALKAVQAQNLLPPEVITAKTELTAVAVDDVVLISDTSDSGALKKITPANLNGRVATATTALAGRVAGATVTTAHNLPATPSSVLGVIVCTDAGGDVGWAENDEIPFDGVLEIVTGLPVLTAVANATNVIAIQRYDTTSFAVVNQSTGLAALIAPAKWSLKIYCRL